MTTKLAVRNAKVKAVKKTITGPGDVVQEALQVTWLLKGNLKNAQLSYIRVGILLARVRDEKLFSALKHPDIESYGEARLSLKRASLFRYLQVHDWIAEFHPEWLLPKPKGFIPELNDAFDLIWIDSELARPELPAKTKTDLQGLKKKALAGTLAKSELVPYRRKGRKGSDARKAFVSKLRLLRRRGAQLSGMPAETISHLDAAIDSLMNALTSSVKTPSGAEIK